MLLGFKTELKLNTRPQTQLAKHCGVARHAWNWGLWLTKNILDHNKAHPNEKLKFPTALDLHKLLVALVKSENPWYYECSKSTPQQALIALREAWKRCFNKTAGVPRFKKKGRRDSFTLEGTVKILGNTNSPKVCYNSTEARKDNRMKVNYQERIEDTEADLKIIMLQQRTVTNRQKVQALGSPEFMV